MAVDYTVSFLTLFITPVPMLSVASRNLLQLFESLWVRSTKSADFTQYSRYWRHSVFFVLTKKTSTLECVSLANQMERWELHPGGLTKRP